MKVRLRRTIWVKTPFKMQEGIEYEVEDKLGARLIAEGVAERAGIEKMVLAPPVDKARRGYPNK